MSTAHAKNGSAIEPRAAQEATSQVPAHRPTPGLCQDQGALLAQIPDLDSKTTPAAPKKWIDGRIISQALSVKLVFGLGLGLVIGAILPFVFGKSQRRDREVKELSTEIRSNTTQTMAPAWSPSVAAGVPQTTPAPAPAILSPQPPQVGDTRPTAPTEPAWQQTRPAIAPGPAVTPSAPNNYSNPPVANRNPPDYRGVNREPRASALDPRNVQADLRNDTAALYRNIETRYDNRANPAETAPARREVPPEYSRDPRYGNPGNNYPPAAGPGSPLMPSNVQGPTSYSDPRVSEPGVARFEGTIATPPVRTSYDRTGSSTN